MTDKPPKILQERDLAARGTGYDQAAFDTFIGNGAGLVEEVA